MHENMKTSMSPPVSSERTSRLPACLAQGVIGNTNRFQFYYQTSFGIFDWKICYTVESMLLLWRYSRTGELNDNSMTVNRKIHFCLLMAVMPQCYCHLLHSKHHYLRIKLQICTDTHHYRCLQLTPSLFILARKPSKPSRRWFHRFHESGFGLQFQIAQFCKNRF